MKNKSIKLENGGQRKNCGAKPKYNEPTTTIAFRVPVSKVEEIKSLVKNNLIKYLKS